MTAGSERRARPVTALLLLTLAAILLAILLPGRPVPIYDGIGAPDEPYRFVSRPAGDTVDTKPPTSVSQRIAVDHGVVAVIQLATLEQGPQAEADVTDQGLTVASTAVATLTATLTPLAPDQGSSIRIDGNVYRLGWVAGGAAVQFGNGGSDLMYLRATVGPPPRATMLYRSAPGTPWRALATELSGADVYSALIAGPGDYALTRAPFPSATVGAARSARRGVPVELVLGVVLVVAMVAVIVAVRILRTRRMP